MSEEHDFSGMYRAKVISNTDVNMLGRIKAEVYPMLIGIETARLMKVSNSKVNIEGIATDQLPWVVPAFPLFAGGSSGAGWFAVPEVDSFVFVFFEGRDINQPVYFAEAPHSTGLPTGAGVPTKKIISSVSGCVIEFDDATGTITITGATDVVIQGEAAVRINPL